MSVPSLARSVGGPPSPCPSEHPFSSASSSLSEGSSSHRSHEDDISIITGIFLILFLFIVFFWGSKFKKKRKTQQIKSYRNHLFIYFYLKRLAFFLCMNVRRFSLDAILFYWIDLFYLFF